MGRFTYIVLDRLKSVCQGNLTMQDYLHLFWQKMRGFHMLTCHVQKLFPDMEVHRLVRNITFFP